MKQTLQRTSLAAAGLAASGCALWPSAPASPVCDFELQRTSAWVNAMPMADGTPRQLIVMMLVEDDGISRRLDRQPAGHKGRATFSVVEWGPEAGLGKAVYRGPPEGAEAVDIYCDGDLVTSVEKITLAR